MKKKLLLVSALVTALSTGAVYAERGDQDCGRAFNKWGQGAGMMGHKHNPEEMLERELSKDQVRTLVEARLIMKGNENLKVGKVSSSRDGFKVDIVTRDDSLVKELELAKNGMPLKVFEHIKERVDKDDAHRNYKGHD
jgi:hypothetical protein